MAYATTWRVVEQIDTSAGATTTKGKPQKKVHTDKNEWMMVTGEGCQWIKPGDKIEISEPQPYGKNNTLYATFQSLDPALPKPPAPTPNGAAPAASNGNGSGKIPWMEFTAAFRAAHAMALEVEPDSHTNIITSDGAITTTPLDRSTARAALVNTAIIAFSNGKIETPEIEATPFD